MLKDCPEAYKAFKDHKAGKGIRVIKVFKAIKVFRELLAQLESKVMMVWVFKDYKE